MNPVRLDEIGISKIQDEIQTIIINIKKIVNEESEALGVINNNVNGSSVNDILKSYTASYSSVSDDLIKTLSSINSHIVSKTVQYKSINESAAEELQEVKNEIELLDI